jgi:tetratricopeptide (TPR) repeat protein
MANVNARELNETVNNLLDEQNYSQAKQILTLALKAFSEQEAKDLYLYAEIAGSLITLGSESYDEEAVKQGLHILESNKEFLVDYVTAPSIEYCIGNGKHALYKIAISGQPYSFPTPEVVREHLVPAKAAYFKAYKMSGDGKLDTLPPDLLTNLGNTLNHSGRIVEAIQLFDTVLKQRPDFPQALGSKADGLEYMMRTSQCPVTTSLFINIYLLYQRASQHFIAPQEIKLSVDKGIIRNQQILRRLEVTPEQIVVEHEKDLLEYEAQPHYRRFCLDRFLTLSEHALYCKCVAASRDTLTIGYEGMVTTNRQLLRLELLNNRVKSEFSMARRLYYEALEAPDEEEFMHYQDLSDGSINGLRAEKLRTAFRLCFGLLDKIAKGICYLFALPVKAGESIYFESFWNSRAVPDRWKKINSVQNIHLTALYSIASDLNVAAGELGFYKDWRNKLEHGIFTVRATDRDPLKLYEEQDFADFIEGDLFAARTEHLLQLVRAAVFSFVFCVRIELLKDEEIIPVPN